MIQPTPATRRYAAIDIGSNAARLLIKSAVPAPEPSTEKLLFLRVPLRLGADVFSQGHLSETKARNLCRFMKVCRHLMRIYDVDAYRACATSAMRDADGGPELIADIERKTGLHTDIITGEQEARIIYGNHFERHDDTTQDYLYVDVGGGSTEVNLLREGRLALSRSYNIGTVRMLCGTVEAAEVRRLQADMALLRTDTPLHIVGSGGNINKLARLLAKKRKEKAVDPAALDELRGRMEALTAKERQEEFGLKADRADVIVPAAKVFCMIAALTGADDIQVPVIGLADGLIDSMVREDAADAMRDGKER